MRIFASSAVGGLATSLLFAVAIAKAADNPMFDVAFGAAVTSDYISNGITQTDHKAAIQGYVEADYGILYAGVWASNVSFGGDADTEIDLSAGIRPEIGKFSFDFGYLHGLYVNDVSTPWDEVDLSASYAATDTLTFASKVAYVITTKDVTPEVSASYSLPMGFELSSRLAYVSYSDPTLFDYLTWDAGVSWTWNDTLKLDVRYYGSDLSGAECLANSGVANACDTRVVATLSVDTSFSALKGGK
jgi:uncharacterized protein (TIGR02001 family)